MYACVSMCEGKGKEKEKEKASAASSLVAPGFSPTCCVAQSWSLQNWTSPTPRRSVVSFLGCFLPGGSYLAMAITRSNGEMAEPPQVSLVVMVMIRVMNFFLFFTCARP